MTTQNENANYEFQSFEQYPHAPMYPAGWDLSEMQSDTKETLTETQSADEEA